MLQDIRDKSQGLISKVIVGAIVAIFALFGAESLIGGFATPPGVAEVNGEEITEQQLLQESQRLLGSLGGSLGSIDQDLIDQIALNQIIEETILRQSAEQASLVVSSDRLDRSIIENPNFQINGEFDSEFAALTMQSQFLGVSLYRSELAKQMMMSQLVNAFTATGFVTEPELEQLAALIEQKRDFRYLSIPMGTRTLGTAISDDEIQRYYDSNLNDYQIEESVSVAYVVLDKSLIAEEVAVDESILREQYEAERANYEGSAEKRASHIMIELSSAVSEEEAIARLNEALQELNDGADFGDVALEYSDDIISAEEGGDIGYTDGSAFPEAVEAALETLSLNEVSAPVVSDFGVHLVKLTEDQENVFQSFEEVSSRLERELTAAEVERLFAERLETLSNLAFESGDLNPINTELGLDIQQSDTFTRTNGSGLFAEPAIVSAAFADEVLLEGNNSDVIELTSGQAVVLRNLAFNEASFSPLEEVQGEIAVALRTEMEIEAAQLLGDEIFTALEAGDDISEILNENDLAWIDGRSTGRNEPTVNREILTRLFAMIAPAPGEVVRETLSLDNGTFVMLELNNVIAGDMASVDEATLEDLRNTIKGQSGNADFQSYLANLREASDISSRRLEEQF